MIKFCDNGCGTADAFLSFAASKCTVVLCNKASEATGQNITPLWQELRYGHITALEIHDIIHCKIASNSFLHRLIGTNTVAMTRGRKLESIVLNKKCEK
jgi:hypothetical protein